MYMGLIIEILFGLFVLSVIIWFIYGALNHRYIIKMYHNFGPREVKIGHALMFTSNQGWIYQTDDFELFLFEKDNKVKIIRVKICTSIEEYEKFRPNEDEDTIFLACYRLKRKLKHEDRDISFSIKDLERHFKVYFKNLNMETLKEKKVTAKKPATKKPIAKKTTAKKTTTKKVINKK